jgi:hypothetical protein
LRAGPRSRRRRGIAISNPLHSVQGAMWNFERLGISWWLYSFAVNSWRRLARANGRLARRHEQLLVSGEVRLKEVLAINKKPRRIRAGLVFSAARSISDDAFELRDPP